MAIPNRFTLRQAAQARDDFAQIMDELDFVKEQLARLPTRRDQAFTLRSTTPPFFRSKVHYKI